MLTKKQRDLLLLIHDRMSKGDLAPSFDEMRDALDLKSKSGIHRLITALVERGYLERLPHRARALAVKKLPEGYVPPAHDATPAATLTRSLNSVRAESVGVETIPLCGKIAAGTPIEAIRHEGASVDIPASLLGRGEFYALQVEGDSMIDAGIHSGDVVVIKRTERAENGRIVVALVDGEEVTLKRLRRKDGQVILQAENAAYEDRVFPPERVQIQGELASLLRTYH